MRNVAKAKMWPSGFKPFANKLFMPNFST
jgi:hypothetical protein